MGPVPDPPPSPSLDQPTPAPPADQPEEDQVSITEINLEDSAELTEANMQALLARAKQAGQQAAKKTRMAFDTTQALADSGMLKLPPKTKKFRRTEKINGASNGADG
jgi:hemolysin activation/secretion protein